MREGEGRIFEVRWVKVVCGERGGSEVRWVDKGSVLE